MTLLVCPLSEVDSVLDQHRPSHVATLLGPTAQPPACLQLIGVQRLHLTFNDIVEPAEGQILATAEHLGQLLAFGRTWERRAPMLVHCWAGISRSTAAAFILATDRLGPGSEARLAQALREASPSATPNSHMIALADDMLGRGGAMSKAIKAIGRGLEAPAGKTFELKL